MALLGTERPPPFKTYDREQEKNKIVRIKLLYHGFLFKLSPSPHWVNPGRGRLRVAMPACPSLRAKRRETVAG